MAWVTWRQHRWAIGSLAVVAVAGVFGLLWTEFSDAARARLPVVGFYALILQLAFGGVVGMFLGAPLIGRELEERTYFVAWGQDLTPVQWLRRKLVLLGAVAVVLAALIGVGDGRTGPRATSWLSFEANSLVQVGYVLMGLAVGVLAGLVTKHTLTAMAVTLVVFGAVRVALAYARGYYLPSDRAIVRWNESWSVPPDAITVGDGFVNSSLEPIGLSAHCAGDSSEFSCMRRTSDAIGTYVDYQPVARIAAFQFIEFLLCVLIAAGLFAVTFFLLRRGGGWRPSRAHRRDVLQDAPAQSVPATAAAQAEG